MAPPRTRRLALATVELVMVLPVLLLFAALILKVGQVVLAKMGANLEARSKIYTTPPGREPAGIPDRSPVVLPLQVKKDSYGLAEPRGRRTVSLRPVDREMFAPEGRVAVLLGTWDHRGIPFKDRSDKVPLSERAALLAAVPADAYNLAGLFGAASSGSLFKADNFTKMIEEELGNALKGMIGVDTIVSGLKLFDILKEPDKFLEGLDAIKDAKKAIKAVQELTKKLAKMFEDPLRDD